MVTSTTRIKMLCSYSTMVPDLFLPCQVMAWGWPESSWRTMQLSKSFQLFELENTLPPFCAVAHWNRPKDTHIPSGLWKVISLALLHRLECRAPLCQNPPKVGLGRGSAPAWLYLEGSVWPYGGGTHPGGFNPQHRDVHPQLTPLQVSRTAAAPLHALPKLSPENCNKVFPSSSQVVLQSKQGGF